MSTHLTGKKVPKVGVGVLIFKGNQVLVGQRKGAHGSGTFALPGGNLEYLEQLESCAVRETKEETGLAVVNPRIEWLENCIFGEGDDRVHYLTVFVRADLADEDAEPQLMEPDKCSGWQWVHWLDVPKPVFAPLQQLLRSVYSPLHGDGVSGLLVR